MDLLKYVTSLSRPKTKEKLMNKIQSIVCLLLFVLPALAFSETELPEPKNDTEARNLETARLWIDEVWANGRLELVSDLVAPEYVRHNASGSRTVTPESYAEEIKASRARGTVFFMNAISIDGNVIWVRWSGNTQSSTGEMQASEGYKYIDSKVGSWQKHG